MVLSGPHFLIETPKKEKKAYQYLNAEYGFFTLKQILKSVSMCSDVIIYILDIEFEIESCCFKLSLHLSISHC